jgi:hypothetical protein
MTAHPNDGLILAFLDGELDRSDQEEILTHLEGCGACRSTAHDLRESFEAAAQGLAVLDTEAPMELARASLERRFRRESSRPSLRFPGLARAAGIALLLVGGAASALPGSPVRQWIASGWDRLTRGGDLSVEEVGPEPFGPESASVPGEGEAGAGIGTADGEIELRVLDLPEGAEVRVLLVDGDHAGIYGPPGTHFRTEAGRIEAVAPSGSVRVELQRGARSAQVIVHGELYLRKIGDRLEILGPVRDSAAAEIRFQPGAARNPNGEAG